MSADRDADRFGGTRFIVLLGLMGTGKTSVGRILARRTGWPLRDSDVDIAAQTGQTARELEHERGADGLHELEAAHLLGALADPGPAVITAAASTVEVEQCRAALRRPGVLAVWLEASPEALAARFASAPHRPSYGDSPREFLEAQLHARGGLFASVAGATVDAERLVPEQIADRIIAAL